MQGDQIRKTFASWAIVYFGQFFENDINSPKIKATYYNGKCYILISTKIGLGYILGGFFHKLARSPCLDVALLSVTEIRFPLL
jgi:hypothetical protein